MSSNKSVYKVCHMTSGHSRYDTRIFRKECISLANHGYEVTLIVNDDKPNETISNVNIVSTNYLPKSRMQRMVFSNKIFYRHAIKINADIYHFHDPELLHVGNKLKKRGKKVIFDSHEYYKDQINLKYYIPKYIRNLISKIYYKYETFSVKKIDAVIFPCTMNHINPFDNRSKRTVFINNVPLLDEFYNEYNSYNFKNGRSLCLIGSLTYERGITHSILAANKAKARLTLAGKFLPQGYYNKIINMKEYNCVDYKGYLNREEVLEVYKNNKIGICTLLNIGQYSRSDNLATKVYEYMSMGLPVIISDYPYSREVLKEYKFGIAVDPEKVDDIAEAINYLLSNYQVSEEMGLEGRRAVKEKFNWSIEEKKLLDLYSSLCE